MSSYNTDMALSNTYNGNDFLLYPSITLLLQRDLL